MKSLDRLKKCLILKCTKMKLESLKLKNFLDAKMDNQQMSVSNGGLIDAARNTVTPAGSGCGYGSTSSDYYQMYSYNSMQSTIQHR